MSRLPTCTALHRVHRNSPGDPKAFHDGWLFLDNGLIGCRLQQLQDRPIIISGNGVESIGDTVPSSDASGALMVSRYSSSTTPLFCILGNTIQDLVSVLIWRFGREVQLHYYQRQTVGYQVDGRLLGIRDSILMYADLT